MPVDDLVSFVLHALGRALDLENGSPAGIANVFAMAILLAAMVFLAGHELILDFADLGGRGIVGLVNLFGEWWWKRRGWRWRKRTFELDRPSRSAMLKLVALFATLVALCPIALAAALRR